MTDKTLEATQAHSVRSEVEVAVSPATAFQVFTAEMDLWWQRGPINNWNSGRVIEMRCEPGVGGRVGEVLDDKETGEFAVKARITVWEPGVRLCWEGTIDDVRTEILFEPTKTGTRVIVEHTIPAGGSDRGGTSWGRVVPDWLPQWIGKRDRVPHVVVDLSRLGLALHYKRPLTAARWLASAFGFGPTDSLPKGEDPLPNGDHGHPWIEFRIGNASLMIFPREEDRPPSATHVPWVYVDDLEAHLAHARSAGAKILKDHEWDFLPSYETEDIEGNRWTFLQARPTM